MASPSTYTTEQVLLTGHELLFLLGLQDSESSRTSRRVMGMLDVAEAVDHELFGLTTLLARGLGHVTDDGSVVPDGPAHHVAVALLHADTWARVVVAAEDGTSAYTVLRSPTASVVLRAVELGINEVVPVDPEASLLDLAVELARESLGAQRTNLMCVAQVQDLSGPVAAATLQLRDGAATIVPMDATSPDDAFSVPIDEAFTRWVAALRTELAPAPRSVQS